MNQPSSLGIVQAAELESKQVSSGLSPEKLAHLERDRWPEFERELRKRRSVRFHVDGTIGTWPRWAGLVMSCRTWGEVERVLNHFRCDYQNHHENRRRSMVCEELWIASLK